MSVGCCPYFDNTAVARYANVDGRLRRPGSKWGKRAGMLGADSHPNLNRHQAVQRSGVVVAEAAAIRAWLPALLPLFRRALARIRGDVIILAEFLVYFIIFEKIPLGYSHSKGQRQPAVFFIQAATRHPCSAATGALPSVCRRAVPAAP